MPCPLAKVISPSERVIPLLNVTTAVSDKGQKPTNLKGGGKVESMKSKVQLKRAVEV